MTYRVIVKMWDENTGEGVANFDGTLEALGELIELIQRDRSSGVIPDQASDQAIRNFIENNRKSAESDT